MTIFKKITIVFSLIFMLMISSVYADTFDIKFFNASNVKKIYRLEWANHPYGCYQHYGVVKCDYFVAVGDLTPWEIITVTRPVNDNILCIKWDHPSALGLNETFEKNCFNANDNIEIIISTPEAIDIHYKGSTE
jgi:hypothetical protein